MTQKTSVFLPLLLLLWCISCVETKPISAIQTKESMNIKIKGIAKGHVKSGNYGGSTQFEVFPSVYNYSYYDLEIEENEENRVAFNQILASYLKTTKANNFISLEEYINYLHKNDTQKLKEIHQQNQEKMALGSINQPLPILFFLADAQHTVLEIVPYYVSLDFNEYSTKLNLFLQKNAKHFSSTIPDQFYTTYFGN